MRDYSTINATYKVPKRNYNPTPAVNNNENVVDGPTYENGTSKGIKKDNNYLSKVRRHVTNNAGFKEASNHALGPAYERKALVDIKKDFMVNTLQVSAVPEESNMNDKHIDDASNNPDSSDENAQKITDIIKTPAAKKGKIEDVGVEATNHGYASVSKLSEWLADRPFDSTKKGTMPVPSTCPATHAMPLRKNDWNGTKKTLFRANVDCGSVSNTVALKQSRLQLKSIASAPNTLPPANKDAVNRNKTKNPHNFTVNNNPYGPPLHRKKTKIDNEEVVEATNEGYASVKDLSHWLGKKPFDKKKINNITSKKGRNVLEKSLAFEPDQPIPTVYAVQKECTKYNNVSDRKNWLQNQAFTKND